MSAFPEISKAKDDYLNEKHHAKYVVWLAKAQASEEVFKPTDSQGSNSFWIAKQVLRENEDILSENFVLNNAGDLRLTDEQKMLARVEHWVELLNIELEWSTHLLPQAYLLHLNWY